MEYTRTLIDTNGAPYQHVGRYTEIANGLHYLVDGEWVESEEIIEPHPRGAVARRGLYRVLFQANLNNLGAIEIEMPGGQLLRNHPLGIYATDVSLGRSVLLGQLKDSVGVVRPPNEVLYFDAFEGIAADMVYRYRKGSFEASAVLRERPLLPGDFNPESTLIELATEFIDPPQRILNDDERPIDPDPEAFERADQLIDFGDMQMVRGKAFSADTGSDSGEDSAVPVVKRWLVAEGRQVLFESVRLESIAPLIEALPLQRNPLPDQAAVGGEHKLPLVPKGVTELGPMLLTQRRADSPGLVLDYIIVVSSPSTTFYSGPTFVIINSVWLNGSTWIQNGAIVKFAPEGVLIITGYLLTPDQYGSRAILTSKNDDSVGEPLGSNPTQQSHYILLSYVQPVADLYYHYPGKIQRLDIRYASIGLSHCSPDIEHEVWNCRFEQCLLGVYATYMTVRLNDLTMCNMTQYENRWYQAGPGATIIREDIIGLCTGFPAPEIITQPVRATVNAGASKSFTVVANGKCLLYQWYFNGVTIPGAKYPTLTLYPVQLSHAGQYHVVVRNDAGFVTSDRVTLTVNNSPPQIYQQPFSQRIRTGGTARFAVGAAPAGVTYQWFKGENQMTGKTSYELILNSVTTGDSAAYKVRVRSAGVDVFSQPAALTVPATWTSVTNTLNEDFAKGILINLNFTSTANQLQMNANPTPLPFLNVPCSGRGTLARIDVNTGKMLGEYATAGTVLADPSRTAVDRGGNVWVANRGAASVTKFGVIVGGIRGNKVGSTLVPDPSGQYLGPPFIYNTCRDRLIDGLIKTSRGLANILTWNDDEAMIFNVPWTNKKPRALAVDKDDNVWVGGGVDYSAQDQPHQKFDGLTGAPIGNPFNQPGYGGYGGLIDGYGNLWSAGGAGTDYPGLLRANVGVTPVTFNLLGNAYGDYGIGIDPKTQRIWYASRQHSQLAVYNWYGTLNTFYSGYPSDLPRGLVVDNSSNVWVAHSSGEYGNYGKVVGHFRPEGTGLFVGNVDLMFVPPEGTGMSGCQPTGLAVDSNGKIWVVNRNTDTAMRIDPNAGPEGGGTHRIGAVDLTVDLGDGSQHTGDWQYRAAAPYAYSDMTGFVTLGSTFSSGSWVFVHDEGMLNRVWNKIAWNGSTPYGTGIKVEVRASNILTDLPNLPFTMVLNDQQIANMTGRYLEVRVTLHRQPLIAQTAVLYDLTVKTP